VILCKLLDAADAAAVAKVAAVAAKVLKRPSSVSMREVFQQVD